MQVEQANIRADEGIKAANNRADVAIAEANDRAVTAIIKAQENANELVQKERDKAAKKMNETKAIKAEAEEIIAQKDSIIKAAMDKAQRIVQDAIDSATSKAKEALAQIKSKVKELTGKKKDMEAEIKEKTGIGDSILAEKKNEAERILNSANQRSNIIIEEASDEAENIKSKAKKEADTIMNEAIKNSGAEGVAREIDRRLGIVSLKEVADAKKKVLDAYEEFRKFDTDGAVGRSIDEGRMDLIKDWFYRSTTHNADGSVKSREDWHDESWALYRSMEKYIEINEKPHSRDEVLEEIQAVMARQFRGRAR